MGTPSARFVINFDANTSGIDQSKSKLADLKSQIESDTAALKEMSDAMQRLKGTAEVVRWEGLPKDIRAAENEVAKLSAKMAKLKDDFAKAPAAKQEGMFAAGLQTQGDLDKATKRLGALKDEQKKLSGTSPVKLFEDLKAGSEKLKASLGKSQTEFSRLGGTLKESKSKLDTFAEGADAAGSPLGGMINKFKQLKALGPAAIYVAIGIAVVALSIGFALLIAKATAFAIAMSDAYRSAALLREAAAGSAEGGKKLEAITLRIEDKTNAQRDAVAGLANEYARLNLSMQSVEGATSAITVATQVMGQQAGNVLKGLIDRGVDTKRFWLGAFDLKGTGLARGDVAKALAKQMGIAVDAAALALQEGRVKLDDGIKALDAAVESRFGAIARKQMLAFPTQIERAKKNLAAIFSGVSVDGFLEKLDSALGLLRETSVVGKALKQALSVIFQPLTNALGESTPLLEGFILGVTIGLQKLVIMGLRVAVVFKKMFGDSQLFKNLDLVKVAAYAGMAAFAALSVVMLALASVFGLFATVLAVASIPLIAIGAAVAALGLAIWWVVDTVATALDQLITYLTNAGTSIADAAGGIVDALVKAIEEGLDDVVKAFKNLGETGVKAFKESFGIASPAKKIYAPAKWLVPGAVKAVEEDTPKFTSAIDNLSESAVSGDAVQGGIMSRIEDAVGTGVSFVVNYYGSGTRDDAREFAGWLADELETQKLARAR